MAWCSNVDSLLQALKTAPADTNKVILLRTLAWKYKLINEDSSLLFYRQSLQLAEQIHYVPGQIQALLGIDSSLRRNGLRDSSVICMRKALQLALEYGDDKYIATCLGQVGNYYATLGYKPDSALYYYDQALLAWQKAGRRYDSWHTYLSRGELYYTIGMMEKGEADILEALAITETKKIRMDYGVALFRLIRNYFDLKEWDKYSKWSETYIRFIEDGNSAKDRNSLYHRGLYFFEDEKQPDKVLPVLKQIALTHEHNHNFRALIDALEFMSGIQWQAGMTKDAINTLTRAAAIAMDHNALVLAEIYYQRLAEMFESEKDPEKALYFFKQYKFIQDSVEQLDNRKHIAELEVKFETAQKEQVLARQGLEIEKRKQEHRSFIWLIVFLFLLIAGIIGYLSTKIKSHRTLEAKNQVILDALSEKELLLNEIHHRVKNNLQVISSLLHLQSKYIEDPTALKAVSEGRNRVNAMSLIHQNLYGKENLATMDVGYYLEKLSEALFHSYNINRSRIELITQVDPVTVDIDILIPLGLIINELISNSLKHAFPGERKGQIVVQLHQDAANLILEIKDNGVGLSAQSDQVRTDSFGMEIVRAFTQKLKGKLEIKNHSGLSTRLIIPNVAA